MTNTSYTWKILKFVMSTKCLGTHHRNNKYTGCPKKSDTIEIILLLYFECPSTKLIPQVHKLLLLEFKIKSKSFISVIGLLDSGVKIFGQSENVLKCLNVNTSSLNSQACNHPRLRAA